MIPGLFVSSTMAFEKAIILLHLARLLRLVRYIKPLKNLFFIIKRLLPTYTSILRLLIVVFYVFVAIGRYWFGGLIYNTNPILAGSDFAQNTFWSMNFNDCASGMVTLFVLQILNNWTTIAHGYVLVTGNVVGASLYFLVFFVVCNLIALNILMALILDCLALLADQMETTEGENLHDDDIEQMASGAGERSAVFMLRKVLCSDEHDHEHPEHSDSASASPSDNEDATMRMRSHPSLGAYGTFGTPHSGKSLTFDDVETPTGAHPKGNRLAKKQSVVIEGLDLGDLPGRSTSSSQGHLSHTGSKNMDDLDIKHSVQDS